MDNSDAFADDRWIMASTMGTSLTDGAKRRNVLAATLALVASTILLVGAFFLVFLAVSDVEEYKDFVGDPGVAPAPWVTVRLGAMAEAADRDPWGWYGVGAILIAVTFTSLLLLSIRLEPRVRRGPF